MTTPSIPASIVLGINASRARSGGAVAHLRGILPELDPAAFGIRSVHLWSYAELLHALPDFPWLVKHQPPALARSLASQLLWEGFTLPRALRETKCSVLLNVDAGSVCRFRPAVTMSRDMLSYEPGETRRYGASLARLRLLALRFVQNASLKSSDAVVFLTRYAATVIQQSCGPLKNVAHIPHGVGAEFVEVCPVRPWPVPGERPVRCLYVSNALPYKHQWQVVRAVAQLRHQGHRLELELVGGGEGPAQERLRFQMAESDPRGEFVMQRPFLPQDDLPALMSGADLFVFASSCENMPNTLLEAMAAGLPIACSRRGPMPEVLKDGGVYFDPENPAEIAAAIESLILDEERRARVAARAKELARAFSWARCSRETFTLLTQTARNGPSSDS